MGVSLAIHSARRSAVSRARAKSPVLQRARGLILDEKRLGIARGAPHARLPIGRIDGVRRLVVQARSLREVSFEEAGRAELHRALDPASLESDLLGEGAGRLVRLAYLLPSAGLHVNQRNVDQRPCLRRPLAGLA